MSAVIANLVKSLRTSKLGEHETTSNSSQSDCPRVPGAFTSLSSFEDVHSHPERTSPSHDLNEGQSQSQDSGDSIEENEYTGPRRHSIYCSRAYSDSTETLYTVDIESPAQKSSDALLADIDDIGVSINPLANIFNRMLSAMPRMKSAVTMCLDDFIDDDPELEDTSNDIADDPAEDKVENLYFIPPGHPKYLYHPSRSKPPRTNQRVIDESEILAFRDEIRYAAQVVELPICLVRGCYGLLGGRIDGRRYYQCYKCNSVFPEILKIDMECQECCGGKMEIEYENEYTVIVLRCQSCGIELQRLDVDDIKRCKLDSNKEESWRKDTEWFMQTMERNKENRRDSSSDDEYKSSDDDD